MSQESAIRKLNQAYVDASLAGDVEWYGQHLAEDFVCVASDGSVLDKRAQITRPAPGA